ncbi:MAG TPA: IPT/TIG domain-containing protein [Solirubrobacteraceae bacterium]|nr:IPT/TIG domain-containing protein [Solirubrobacteraceae bacterium]
MSVRVAFPLATVASCTRSFSTSFTGRPGIPTSTELDFAHLLLAHGGPVIGDGRALLADLVDGGGRTAFEMQHGPAGDSRVAVRSGGDLVGAAGALATPSAITAISPNYGPDTGGTSVTIAGSGFEVGEPGGKGSDKVTVPTSNTSSNMITNTA